MTEERIYRSVFLDEAGPHQRYYGWGVSEDSPGLRVLFKRYGMVVRSLILLAGASMSKAAEVVQRARAASILSDVVIHDFESLLPDPPVLGGRRFRRAAAAERLLNMATFAIDLRRDDAELLEAMSADYRRKIRKSASAGIRVDVHDRPDDGLVRRFAAAYAVLARERDLAPLDTEVLRRMYEGGNALLLVAQRGGETTNYLHLYTTRETGLFMHGVNPARENDGAGQYLHWTAMRTLRERGLAWYDLGGVAALDSSNGIYNFKEKFGGRLVMLGPEWRHASPGLRPAVAASRLLRRASARGLRP